MELLDTSWTRVVRNTKSNQDTDERYTPDWVLDLSRKVMGGIDLDPASDPKQRVPALNHFTKEDNGLERGWSGRIFLNPPFSNTSDWVKHLCIYFHSGAVTEAVVLLPIMALSNKSATLLMKGTASAFLILQRKLSFLNESYEDMGEMSAFPFALVYCGNRTEEFFDLTNDSGIGCLIRTQAGNEKHCLCSYCAKPFVAKRSTAKYCGPTCRVEAYRQRTKS